MSLEFLETIGLTKKEAQLYELLLTIGEVPARELIQKSQLKRATAYKSLYALEKKGLVTKMKKDKKIHFRPEPPAALLNLAERQHHELERARDNIQSLIPQLTSDYIMAVEKPIISTFEGVEGLKRIYLDTIKEGKTVYAVLQTAAVNEELFEWLTNVYVKKRVQAKIHAHVIVASGKWSETYQKLDKKEYRTTILVPSEKFPFQHEVNIYGNKVAFMNYRKGEKLIGFIIDHPQTAKTMKSWFDLAWKGAESLEKEAQ